ncbi:2-hydroxyisoflavanone dehydratase-like [Panicum miliaceum]|uniref:2-hydroxyisoflavanone dehydratase-like n=1 Tax=Panicum miliaceum TaxID=4540 RepID=A0A3L6T4K8_PANMI|nr:2-hydroxyisoflavanone dehydratase-like [Panicum miliaceum]
MDSVGGEVVYSCGYFRLYKDGRAERTSATRHTAPAGFDAETGVTSRDVVIDAATGVAARLYLPPAAAGTATKLPVLVFYHGGYFVVGSPSHPLFHRYVNSLAAAARVVVVSVRYRLAPEHPLPAAYDDSWAALRWVASGADPWLRDHGDLGRVFLSGVSAGTNIAHNMAIAAGAGGLPAVTPARVEGVILLHPSFASEQKTDDEDEGFWRANKDRWTVIFPGANGGLDDPRINRMAAGAPSLAELAGERLLVSTASVDPRAPRGRAYCDAVRASGWRGELECFESEGEHGFFVPDHGSREAAKLMDRVADFLAGH